jgi:cobalt/nickel transport system ATP-binding protein
MIDNMIKCNDICYAYDGVPALRHVSFDIREKECVVFRGPNGCGKSTLFKLLNGLIFPEIGTYTFQGEAITERSMSDQLFARRFHQTVGYIFQNSDMQLFCSTVMEELEFGPRQMGLPTEEIDKRCTDVVDMLGITNLLGRAPYHLSGGEKKKVAIGCILTMNPRVLILDEPLAGLDESSMKWLAGFLIKLKESGKTIVVATHDNNLTNMIADRVIEINSDHSVKQ